MSETPAEAQNKAQLQPGQVIVAQADYRRQEPQQKAFLVSVDAIRRGERLRIIQETVKALDEGWEPSLRAAQALLSRGVSDLQYGYIFVNGQPPVIPWPESVAHEQSPAISKRALPFKNDWQYVVPPGASKTFPGGLSDFEDADAMQKIAFTVLARLKPADQPVALNWALDLLGKVPELNSLDYVMNLIGVAVDSPLRIELFQQINSYILHHIEQYHYVIYESGAYQESAVDDLVFDIGFYHPSHEPFIHAVVRETDDEHARKLLGMFIDRSSYPIAINAIRQAIRSTDAVGEKNRLERLGKILLGFSPDDSRPFYLCLNDLYKAIDFEHYPVNEAITQEEVEFIWNQILARKPGGDFTIFEDGAGTGRISNALALKMAEKNIGQIIGIDESEHNIAKARVADVTGRVDYRVRMWDNTGLPDESVDFVIGVGRDYPHDEKDTNFWRTAEEKFRVMKTGAAWLFDFPDPNKGRYKENRKRYMKFLKNMGIPVEKLGDPEEALNQIEYVVDGATNTDLYNRWVPQFKKVIGILERVGFNVSIMRRTPIPYSEEDENVYFLAVKRAKGVSPQETSGN